MKKCILIKYYSTKLERDIYGRKIHERSTERSAKGV